MTENVFDKHEEKHEELWGFLSSENVSVEEGVAVCMGAVSMCWDPPPTGVFDSKRAFSIVDELTQFIEEKIEKAPEGETPRTFAQDGVGPKLKELYHDPYTLDKVYTALMNEGIPFTTAGRVVDSIQKAGILFREDR